MSEGPRRLNLGCGEDYKDGYLNVDWSRETKADIVFDLNQLPYPFPDSHFDEILAYHILEHLDKPVAIMRELHRILSPQGLLHIKVPHFSRGFSHVEHCHGFDVTFPRYFDSSFSRSGYFGFDFSLEKMELHWMAFFHLMPHFGYSSALTSCLKSLSIIVSFMANLSPFLCSRIWCYWVGGFEEIEFLLRSQKSEST